jgi:hypothetical protein
MISTNCFLKSLLLAIPLAAPATSAAQELYVPILPSDRPAFKLDRSRIGTWAEYNEGDGRIFSTQRYSLVAQSSRGYLLEVHIESEVFLEPVVLRFELPTDPEKDTSNGTIDVMIGTSVPLRLTVPHPPVFEGFLAPLAKVRDEPLATPAGKFATSHYLNKIENDAWEYWVSREAPPLGFVRSVKKFGSYFIGVELQRVGAGARAEMTLAPRTVGAVEFGHAIRSNLRAPK